MSSNDGLSTLIEKYVKRPDSEYFSEIYELGKQNQIPLDVFQTLLNTRENNIPEYQLGLLYMLLDRKLDATYYLDIHLKKKPDDLLAWVNYQYFSAQRGDIKNSYKALCKISEIGSNIETYRAEIIHLLMVGDIRDADESARYLIETKTKDHFSAWVVFEVAVMAEDWNLISWLVDIDLGRRLISSARGFKLTKIMNAISERMIKCFKNRIEELSHE